MLKDLQGSLSKHRVAVPQGNIDQTQTNKGTTKDTDTQRDTSKDAINTDAACNIVNHIFHYIDICLREDKSKVKLSLFAKSFIKGMLTNNVKNGIDNFIRNMNNKEIRSLLDDIQYELNKRK
jgi:hypothetical protein